MLTLTDFYLIISSNDSPTMALAEIKDKLEEEENNGKAQGTS